MRPSGRIATALTEPSWNRITCSAASRASDQRITVSSKLPETAVLPSAVTASARTGPPWPRSCACAGISPAADTASASTTRRTSILIRRHHAERADARPHLRIAQRREKGLHGGALPFGFNQQEIVVFRRERQEREPVHARNRLDRDAPVGAALRHRGGDRIVRLRLVGVAGWALSRSAFSESGGRFCVRTRSQFKSGRAFRAADR